ncbi:MAG TPA: CDP-alcohol phosphatidyltransferase family protein [Candidatus Paceibacterota bacterium]
MKTNIFDRTILRPFVAMTPSWLSPNTITIFRLVSVPVVIYFLITGHYKIGAVLFGIAAFSDAVDGAVARTRGTTSKFGAFIDPIADKLLIVSTAFILISRFLPVWIFISIVITELVIVSVALFGKYVKHLDVKANVMGKIKMILQSFGLSFVLIYAAFWTNKGLILAADCLLVIALIFAALSIVHAIIKGKKGEIGF